MKLEEIVPWGRNLAEYRQMFNLSDGDLCQRILGCGDGPASFNAQMTQLGHQVTSIDPLYAFSPEEIRQRFEDTYPTIIYQLQKQSSRYVWQNFRDPEDLGRVRRETMELFLEDYPQGKLAGRYIARSLPQTRFGDREFNLCLCSHLLFLYSDLLSLDMHIASIDELLRVGSQVRIFPLVTLDGEISPYVEPILHRFHQLGYQVKISTVAYEFQRGGNQMLTIHP